MLLSSEPIKRCSCKSWNGLIIPTTTGAKNRPTMITVITLIWFKKIIVMIIPFATLKAQNGIKLFCSPWA
jgi:hypothetical protein